MLFLLSLAVAEEPPLPGSGSPNSFGYAGTVVLPDARHHADGEAEIAAGSFGALVQMTNYCIRASPGGCGPSWEPMAIPSVRVAWTPLAEVRLMAHLGYVLEEEAVGGVAISWSKPVSEVVRMGGYLGVAGSFEPDFTRSDGVFTGGFALSAQWTKLAFDLSIPLFAINSLGEETPFYMSMLLFEAGLSFPLGKGHSLRAGLTSALPGVGWQYDNGHFLARVDVQSVGVLTVGHAEVGARF